jgi:hypothetical protein
MAANIPCLKHMLEGVFRIFGGKVTDFTSNRYNRSPKHSRSVSKDQISGPERVSSKMSPYDYSDEFLLMTECRGKFSDQVYFNRPYVVKEVDVSRREELRQSPV